MTVKYQRQFEIDLNEMEIIETALREQVKQLSIEMLDQQAAPEQDESISAHEINSQMRAIQSLLGNLHNQKTWYRPQNNLPLG